MQDELRRVRHELRGRANVMMLAMAVIDTYQREDVLELLDQIERAAEESVIILDRLEQLQPDEYAH